eukprot:JP435662.1.p1 GENE.JP435662.1~~JP435662.1.p1  ORF type:complete len:808 (-),score=179.90 JP435662.1:131-2554(-)
MSETEPQDINETKSRIWEKVKALVELFESDHSNENAKDKVTCTNKITAYRWLFLVAPMEMDTQRWDDIAEFFFECVNYYIDTIVSSYKDLMDPRMIVTHTVKKYRNFLLYRKVLCCYFIYMGRQFQCVPALQELLKEDISQHSERHINSTEGNEKLFRCAMLVLRKSRMATIIKEQIIGALVTLVSERRKAHCDSVNPPEMDLSQDKDFLDFHAIVQLIVDTGSPNDNPLFDELFKRLSESARSFYQSASVEWVGQYSCYDFFQKVESAQSFELKSIAVYLPERVHQEFMCEFYYAAVASHQTHAMAKSTGIMHLLTTYSTDFIAKGPALISVEGNSVLPIACLYRLFSEVEPLVDPKDKSKFDWDPSKHGLAPLREAALLFFQTQLKELEAQYVPEAKEGTVAGKIDAVGLITEFVKAKIKYDFLIEHAFKQDVTFHKVVQQAYALDDYLAEYMSLFIHQNMRNSTQETESYFPIFVDILERLSNKDMFFEYYKRHFSQRLLGDRKILHMDLENNFLSLLKQRMSLPHLFHLEKMYKDVQTSELLISDFASYASQQGVSVVELANTAVLTQGHWPKIYTKQGEIPPALVSTCNAFDEFYKMKHNGRVLSWDMSKGRAEVKVLAAKCSIEVSTPQLCILLRLNQSDTLDVSTLHTDMGFDARTQNMVKTNYEVMTKPHKQKYWNELLHLQGTTLSVNPAFKCKSLGKKPKFLLESAARPSDRKDRKIVEETVTADRNYEMQCTLVRVMKSHKGTSVKISSLISQATTICQARFMPEPQALKRAIEKLIEGEYFARDENDRSAVYYLA